MATQEGGFTVYTTESSRYEAKKEYSNMVFRIIEKFADAVANSEHGYADPKVDMYVKIIINLILDRNTRERMKEERRQRIHEEAAPFEDDIGKYNKIVFDINMDYFGESMIVFDDFIGVVKKQEILRVASPRLKEIEKKFREDPTYVSI